MINNRNGRIFFNGIKLGIQIVITFAIMLFVALTVVVLIQPGTMENKMHDMKVYTLKLFGINEEPVQMSNNPLEENLGDEAKRITVDTQKGGIYTADAKIDNQAISGEKGLQLPVQKEQKLEVKQQVEPPKPKNATNVPLGNGVVVNNLYYSQLNEYGKLIYDKLRNESAYFLEGEHVFEYGRAFDGLLKLEGGQESLNAAFQAAVNALVLDYPQLFFVDVSHISLSVAQAKYPGFGTTYYVSITNAQGKKFYLDSMPTRAHVDTARAQVEQMRNSLIQRTSGSAVDRVKQIHNYLVDNVEYDDKSEGELKHTLYAALIHNRAVCEGYAKAFKYVADGLGIPTITVVGEGISGGKSEAHAWNYVYIDGAWYGVDATFDDPVVVGGGTAPSHLKERYLLVGKREFLNNHIPNGLVSPGIAFNYPELAPSRY